jgi:hypothetical protein
VLSAISTVGFPSLDGGCNRFDDPSKPVHTLPVDGCDHKNLQPIIDAARQQMGLSETGREVSKNVLRLELASNSPYPLTLVDLPGFHHGVTDDQLSEEGHVVSDMMSAYMRDPNSLILAVVPASCGLADQAVLQEVAKHDPTGERTFAVITKPNFLPEKDDTERQLVNWYDSLRSHAVRFYLDTTEDAFFRGEPWSSQQSQLSVVALRKQLGRFL